MVKKRVLISENNIKNIVRAALRESILKERQRRDFMMDRIIRESIRKNLYEYVAADVPNNGKQQINYSNRMAGSIANGSQTPQRQAQAFSGNNTTTGGRIYNNSVSRGEDYTQVIQNLQNKIKYYLSKGYFGQNQTVVNVIQKFIELLNYTNAYYESQVSRRSQSVNEGLWDNIKNLGNRMVYPEQNRYGVNQRIDKDDSGHQFAVNGDYKGQWMTDLQGTLNEFLKIDYLHGKQTVEATKAFIEFLNVDKRSIWSGVTTGGNGNSATTPQNPTSPNPNNSGGSGAQDKLRKLNKAILIALAALTSLMGDVRGQVDNQQVQVQQQPQVAQTVQQMPQQQQIQNINTAFEFNSAAITNDMAQSLQSLPQGNYIITITNAQGGNQAYNQQLYQQRAQSIQQNLPQGVNATFRFGGINQNSRQANVNITPSQSGTYYM